MKEITYKDFINNIILSRGRFSCGDEYHERHHINPRCCNGTDDEENLIDLFAMEHFEAHRLLALENPNNEKLVYAWWCMCSLPGSSKNREDVTAEEYEEARIAFCNFIIERQTGENNSFYGKHHTEESKRKISDKLIGENHPNYGKSRTDKQKEKQSEAMKGCHLSEEHKKKISQAVSGENNGMYGKHHTNNAKNKMSETWCEKYENGYIHPNCGKSLSNETKKKISDSNKGKCLSEEHKKNLSDAFSGEKSVLSKSVFCIELNRYFGSAREASREINVNQSCISRCVNKKQNTAGVHPITNEQLHWIYTDEINNSLVG